MTDDTSINMARRGLLRKIGLGAGLAYLAPGLSGVSVAHASGGSGGSGPSGPSGPSRSDPPQRPANTRETVRRPVRPAAPAALPEIVALIPAGQSLDPALNAGFTALAQNPLGALPLRLVRFGLPPGQGVDSATQALRALFPDGVTDRNHLYSPDEFLCDGADCQAHAMIGWSGWPSAVRPRIGMIDTGINTGHPALMGRNLQVHQVDLGRRAAAGRQHGTAIAAMLVGHVDGRVPGLLPDATLIAVEAFHASGSGEQADAFSVASALDLLLREGVDVINLSFSGPANEVVAQMVVRAAERGVALVAAAGNGGAGAEPAYPAAWPQVIAVTALDADAQVYRQANQGPYVALAAPGVNVWTAASVSGGRLRSGTSYAAPFVTAAMAVERLRTPSMTTAQVTERLFACARDLGEAGFDPVYGHGLLTAPGQCHDAGDLFSVTGE